MSSSDVNVNLQLNYNWIVDVALRPTQTRGHFAGTLLQRPFSTWDTTVPSEKFLLRDRNLSLNMLHEIHLV